jgi:hypothetical protein
MINEFTLMDLIGVFFSGFLLGFIAKCLFRCNVPQYEIDIKGDDDDHNQIH